MAIQNIVSGGFYGKVGALIGQRWHNIRTIRAYTKPTNPRTQKQQANRKTFAGLTKRAQIGQGMNYKAPCFSDINNSEWGVRMSCASQLEKSGQKGLNLIPLFPYGYIPHFSIDKITLEETQGTSKAIFSVEGEIPSNERDLSILILTRESEESPENVELYRATLNNGTSQTFTIDGLEVSELNEFTKMLIVSNDDKKNNGEMVYAPEQGVELPQIKTRDFNVSIVGVQRSDKTFTITFAEPFINGEYEIGLMKLTGISNGEEKSIYFTPLTFINNNGYFAVSVTQDVQDDSEILAFPQGSILLITSLKVTADRLILVLKSENSQTFDNSDLTRPFYTEIDAELPPEEDDEILYFKQNLQNAISNQIKVDFFEMESELQWEKVPIFLNLSERNGRAVIVAEESLENFLVTEKNATFPLLKGTAKGVTYEAENFLFNYSGNQEEYPIVESSIPLAPDYKDSNGYGTEVIVDEMEFAKWQNATAFNQMCKTEGAENLTNIRIRCKINGVQITDSAKNLRKVEYVNKTTLIFWFDVGRDLRNAQNLIIDKLSPTKDTINIVAKELGLPIATFTL